MTWATKIPVPQRLRLRTLLWSGGAYSVGCLLSRSTWGISGRRSLCSAEHGELLVPFARTTVIQRRAFSFVGPTVWNELLEAATPTQQYLRHVLYPPKVCSFSPGWDGSASE